MTMVRIESSYLMLLVAIMLLSDSATSSNRLQSETTLFAMLGQLSKGHGGMPFEFNKRLRRQATGIKPINRARCHLTDCQQSETITTEDLEICRFNCVNDKGLVPFGKNARISKRSLAPSAMTSCKMQCYNLSGNTNSELSNDQDKNSEQCFNDCCQIIKNSKDAEQVMGLNYHDDTEDSANRVSDGMASPNNRIIEQNLSRVLPMNKCIAQFNDNLISRSMQNQKLIKKDALMSFVIPQSSNPSFTLLSKIRWQRLTNPELQSSLSTLSRLHTKRWGNPNLKMTKQMQSKRLEKPYLNFEQMYPKPCDMKSNTQVYDKRWGNPQLKLSQQTRPKRWGYTSIKLNPQTNVKRNSKFKMFYPMLTKQSSPTYSASKRFEQLLGEPFMHFKQDENTEETMIKRWGNRVGRRIELDGKSEKENEIETSVL